MMWVRRLLTLVVLGIFAVPAAAQDSNPVTVTFTTLTITVLGHDGKPVKGAEVKVESRLPGFGPKKNPEKHGVTGDDGTVQIELKPAPDYFISVRERSGPIQTGGSLVTQGSNSDLL